MPIGAGDLDARVEQIGIPADRTGGPAPGVLLEGRLEAALPERIRKGTEMRTGDEGESREGLLREGRELNGRPRLSSHSELG